MNADLKIAAKRLLAMLVSVSLVNEASGVVKKRRPKSRRSGEAAPRRFLP